MSGPKWSQFANAIQELENSVPDFTVDIRCPKCSDEYDVSRVRRVDLLYDISRELHTKVSPVQVAADDTSDAYSGQEAFDIDERASSAPGPVSPPRTAPTSKRESSLSTSNSNHTRQLSGEASSTTSSARRLKHKFKKSTTRLVPMNFSSCLSIDGDFVIVWTREQVCCYNIVNLYWSPMVWVNDILLAAGSGNHFAVVSGAASKSVS
jgi:methylaspartate ammonia-lyase